jgi:hypothetical protein
MTGNLTSFIYSSRASIPSAPERVETWRADLVPRLRAIALHLVLAKVGLTQRSALYEGTLERCRSRLRDLARKSAPATASTNSPTFESIVDVLSGVNSELCELAILTVCHSPSPEPVLDGVLCELQRLLREATAHAALLAEWARGAS